MTFQGDAGPAGKAGEPGDQGLRVSYQHECSSKKENRYITNAPENLNLWKEFNKLLSYIF